MAPSSWTDLRVLLKTAAPAPQQVSPQPSGSHSRNGARGPHGVEGARRPRDPSGSPGGASPGVSGAVVPEVLGQGSVGVSCLLCAFQPPQGVSGGQPPTHVALHARLITQDVTREAARSFPFAPLGTDARGGGLLDGHREDGDTVRTGTLCGGVGTVCERKPERRGSGTRGSGGPGFGGLGAVASGGTASFWKAPNFQQSRPAEHGAKTNRRKLNTNQAI